MIYVESLSDLAEICARLYHEGIVFEACRSDSTGLWVIQLKGF
jgi:hypothetical protein